MLNGLLRWENNLSLVKSVVFFLIDLLVLDFSIVYIFFVNILYVVDYLLCFID